MNLKLGFVLSLASSLGAWGGCDNSSADNDASLETRAGLAELRSFDESRAEAGKTFLFDQWPGDGVFPEIGLKFLTNLWGTGTLDDDAFWLEFEKRYGFFRPDGAELPLGFHRSSGGDISLSCLSCHTDKGPKGEAIIGVGNRRLDYRQLIDDLQTLADSIGASTPSVPENLQASPGAIDAVFLGVMLAGGDQGKRYGFQQAPAWWTHRYKNRNFADGSGHVENWRTMMATLMVFGWDEAKMELFDPEFKDLQQYLYSLEAPEWPFENHSADILAAGQSVYNDNCASCHGRYDERGTTFPELIVDLDVIGTDPLRATNFGDTEIGLINQSWFAEPNAFEFTEGYLAPPLIGVWATAPYFHNGSVPDLEGVLKSSTRPALWKLDESGDYNPSAGGYDWSTATSDDAKAYDTNIPGLSNAGHTFGDELSDKERSDVIAYLQSL